MAIVIKFIGQAIAGRLSSMEAGVYTASCCL